MQQITLQTAIKRNPELIASSVDGETVMMNINNGEYFGLDPVGSRIWELIEDKIIVEHLVVSLTEEFEVTRDQCERDTLEFLHQLLEKKLVIII